jgi:hypothetical protein
VILSKEPEPMKPIVKEPEPVLPLKEIKLEVQKQEPPKREKAPKQDPFFTVEEKSDTEKLADKLVEEQAYMIRPWS